MIVRTIETNKQLFINVNHGTCFICRCFFVSYTSKFLTVLLRHLCHDDRSYSFPLGNRLTVKISKNLLVKTVIFP